MPILEIQNKTQHWLPKYDIYLSVDDGEQGLIYIDSCINHSFVTPYLIYCFEILGNASDIHLQPLITTQTKIVRIITFSSYCSHTNTLFNHLNVLPFKKLLFLRIGLQMFKYEYDQLPEAPTMFLLRIDLCIIAILETRTNSALLLLSMHTET